MNAWKNCRFHLRPPCNYPVLPALRILGEQLESVRVDYGCNNNDSSELTQAWDRCVSLRRLHVEACNAEHIKAIMSSPKTHLEVLCIRMWPRGKAVVKKVLDICSRGCANVQNLRYCGTEPPQDAFEKFIENNSTLSSVLLYFVSDETDFDRYYDLIQPFVKASVYTEICTHYAVPSILWISSETAGYLFVAPGVSLIPFWRFNFHRIFSTFSASRHSSSLFLQSTKLF